MFRRDRKLLVAALAVAVGFMACDDSVSPDQAQLTVALTDAPSDRYEKAVVEIGEIQILPQDGPPITLAASGGTHDLLELQDGVTADLASLSIDPGTYLQVRLVVESARITLAEGLEFNDGTTERDLFVPSGAQTGIKVNLRTADGNGQGAGIEIAPGETILVVDFDVGQNFVVQGDPDAESGIEDVLFTPLLRASVRDVAASISGTVTLDEGDPVESASVRAELLDSDVMEELQTDEATAVTAGSGDYTIHFLSPGEYEVSVDEFSAAPENVTLEEAEARTDVDFRGTVEPSDS